MGAAVTLGASVTVAAGADVGVGVTPGLGVGVGVTPGFGIGVGVTPGFGVGVDAFAVNFAYKVIFPVAAADMEVTRVVNAASLYQPSKV